MMVFTTGSKSNPTRVLIPVGKILKVVENTPIKDRYEDYHIYCPSSVYLDSAGVDGKDVIHVFETVDQILEEVSGEEPF